MDASRRHGSPGGTPGPGGEAGFSILESVIALSVVFVVLIGLLGSLTAGARGLTTGRQRGVALALANEVVETARGRAYAEVGHDLDSDPTLPTDPLITGAAPNWSYTGVTPPEPLASSSVDAGAAAGTPGNPVAPFSPHVFTSPRESTVYTASVYVTTHTPSTGAPYKRLTVKVSWSGAQYSTARSVTLSTFLYDAKAPPAPDLTGSGQAEGGSLTVSGSLAGISLATARLSLASVSGQVESGATRSASGFAQSAGAGVDLLSGLLSGCSLLGLGAACDPVKAEAGADDDAGTAAPETDQTGPVSAASGGITVGTVLSAALGSGTAQAQGSARSCWSCQAGGTLPVGDDDGLPYFAGLATGPTSASVGFLAGLTSGSLLSIGAGCAVSCATVTLDRDDSGGSARLTSSASLALPALGLMSLAGVGGGYQGMVRIAGLSATATAAAGPGASGTGVSAAPVAVQLWHTTGVPGYTTVNATPGAAPPADLTTHAALSAGAASVVMDATAHWNEAVASSEPSTGPVTDAAASLPGWLTVDVHVVITSLLGLPLANLNLRLDYGRLAAAATYRAAP